MILLSMLICLQVLSQNTQRPFIWVKQEDRAKIIKEIETQVWAKSFCKEFKE